MYVNYYNYGQNEECPFSIVAGQDNITNIDQNYVLNQNNLKFVTNTIIKRKQKVLGLLDIDNKNKASFYFVEFDNGNSISSNDSKTRQLLDYLKNYYVGQVSLNDVLLLAGAKFTNSKETADIDLSPENVTKETFITLLKT